MRPARFALALAAVFGPLTGQASGQTVVTLSDVLARARQQAPEIVSARLAIEESRARLAGASVRLTSNPEIAADVGNRRSGAGRFTDYEFGLSQAFEPGARRTARMAGATAGIDRATAMLDETTRQVFRASAAAYFRAVHATERIRLLTTAEELAARVRQTTERRLQAGDVAQLDVNLTRASLARVRSERSAAAANLALAVGALKALLGIDDDIQVQGSLAPAETPPPSLLETALRRPELAELEAEIRAAEADVQLGQAFQKPELGLAARDARDGGDQVISGGLKITFPISSSGLELRATGSARAARLRSDLDRARARIRTEVLAAQEAYDLHVAAIRVLETEALPGLDENDTLASRSFEVGQIGLTDFLLIRREILETRFQYLDALLEAALARIDLLTSAGVLR